MRGDPVPPELAPAADEAALVAALQAGEEHAFEHMVRVYGPRLRGVTRRFLRNDEDADEVLQEAFLSAFRALPGFEGRSGLGTWLHRIAVNAALTRLRARASEPEADVDRLLPGFTPSGVFLEPQAAWEGADEGAEREDLRAFVRASIDRLPEKHRIALLLRDVEDLANEEVARRMGVSVNAAKIRIHRARQALKTLLGPRFTEPGA